MCSAINVACGLPSKLDFFSINIGTLSLSVHSFYDISVSKVPLSLSFWLIKSEGAFEIGSVRISPLALYKISILEAANILLSSLLEDVSALSVFLSSGPVSRVDVFILVSHDSFAVTLAILPVAVIFTNIFVKLLANTVLLIVCPGTFIRAIASLLRALGSIGVLSLAGSNLQAK